MEAISATSVYVNWGSGLPAGLIAAGIGVDSDHMTRNITPDINGVCGRAGVLRC